VTEQEEASLLGEEEKPLPGVGRLVIACAFGSLVGAAAAMLLSPWRGAEARLRLKYRLRECCSVARHRAIGMGRRHKGMHTHA